jgi:hypothetical protein
VDVFDNPHHSFHFAGFIPQVGVNKGAGGPLPDRSLPSYHLPRASFCRVCPLLDNQGSTPLPLQPGETHGDPDQVIAYKSPWCEGEGYIGTRLLSVGKQFSTSPSSEPSDSYQLAPSLLEQHVGTFTNSSCRNCTTSCKLCFRSVSFPGNLAFATPLLTNAR